MSHFSRRMFLRGAQGAALAIPCLTSLLSREARAAYVPPKRFVAMSADHGVNESRWYPAGYKRMLPAGERFTSRDLTAIQGPISDVIGAPFNGLKSKLTLLRGLDSAVLGPQAGHTRSFVLAGTTFDGGQPGSSIDIVLGASPKVRLSGTALAHVSAGIHGENHSFKVDGDDMRAPFMYSDARQLFEFLFAGFEPMPSAEATEKRRRKLLLVDQVLGHYKRVSTSSRLGSSDKRVLANFVEDFAAVEQRLKNGSMPQNICEVRAPAFAAYEPDNVNQYAQRIHELLDVLALALKCGIIQVAHFGFPTPEDSRPIPASNYAVFKQLDTDTVKFTLPIHDYSHNGGNWGDTTPIFQRWLAGFVARFLTTLDVQEQGDSSATYLDNSLVAYQNNLSNGNIHLRYDMPVLLGGGLSGRFVTGKFLDYSQNIQHTIENSVGKQVGIDFNRYLVAVLQGFGLNEADYQQPRQPPGFGSDRRHGGLHPDLDTSRRREPLPGLLVPA